MHDYDDHGKIIFLSDDIQSSKKLPKMSDSTFIAPKRLCTWRVINRISKTSLLHAIAN